MHCLTGLAFRAGRALTGHEEKAHSGAVVGCRGGVLVSDSEEPAFPFGAEI